jgi:hypothetical protein
MDQDLGSRAPESGIGIRDGRNSCRDKYPGSYFLSLEEIFWLEILQFYVADPKFGALLTLDSGTRMEKFGSGMSINTAANPPPD